MRALTPLLSGEVRQSIPFDQTSGFYAYPADIDGDGVCEFIDHAGGWSPVGLYDASGHKVFSYGKNMGRARPGLIEIDWSPQDVIAFDYAGDGVRELLIPLLVVASPTTHIVDRNGQLITSLPLDLKGCRAADLNQDGHDSLVCLRHRGRSAAFVVYDESIKLRHEYPVSLEGGHHQVRLIKWPNTHGSWHTIYNSPDGLAVLDLTTGQQRVVSRIAGLSYLNTWFVKFDPVQKPFVVSTQHYKDTVTVVIYTHDGNRAYQETLKRGGTAAVLPQPNNTEQFLVFGVRARNAQE